MSVNERWKQEAGFSNKEYKGKVIIDDTLKAAIDAYYEQYGAK